MWAVVKELTAVTQEDPGKLWKIKSSMLPERCCISILGGHLQEPNK